MPNGVTPPPSSAVPGRGPGLAHQFGVAARPDRSEQKRRGM